MQEQAIDIQRYRRPGAYAWVVLCALVLFQVAWAAHDTQHTIGDIADSCAMCVQLDEGGNAVVSVDADAIAISREAVIRPLTALIADRQPAGSKRSRAPPRS